MLPPRQPWYGFASRERDPSGRTIATPRSKGITVTFRRCSHLPKAAPIGLETGCMELIETSSTSASTSNVFSSSKMLRVAYFKVAKAAL